MFTAGLRCAGELRGMEDSPAYSVPAAPPIPAQIEARVCYERNDLDGARRAGEEAIARLSPYPASQFLEIQRLNMLIALALGDRAEAWERIYAMEGLQLSEPDQGLRIFSRMMRAWLEMLEGRNSDALSWVEYLEGESPGKIARVTRGSFTYRGMAEILYGRVLAHTGRIGDAIEILTLARADLIRVNLITMAIEAGALLAGLLESEGRPEAIEILEETLKLGAPERFIRMFINEGAPVARLLERYRATRRTPSDLPADYLRSVLDACGVGTNGGVDRAATRASTIDDPDALTSRELEILRLMSIGYSNQKIADKLYLSINTIKTHISNLFDKLGARNRVDALVRAREAGVLE
jgi:LuxR family maltose regulon positive regulatory protein